MVTNEGHKWNSHNHGPDEGRGMDCPEKPIGQCIRDARDAVIAEQWAEIERLRGTLEAANDAVAEAAIERAEDAEAKVARCTCGARDE